MTVMQKKHKTPLDKSTAAEEKREKNMFFSPLSTAGTEN